VLNISEKDPNADMQQNSFEGYSLSLDKYDYLSLKKGGVRFAKGRQQ
jgi:hypothetical protein